MENKARRLGYQHIAGVDEAGRGPLAGPVVAAACMFPKGVKVKGVDDSKKLTPEARFKLYEELISHPKITYGVGVIDALVIDEINILQATFRAMILAVASLSQKPDYIFVDGNLYPPFDVPGEAVVEGDALCFSISAASIIAKETRDRIMQGHHIEWPEYGFHKHKGYGTQAHRKAIAVHGPCPIHRMSFSPFAKKEASPDPQLHFDVVL